MAKSPKVLYICEKLPHNIRSGSDLRLRSQILALSEFCSVGVIGLSNPGPSISNKIDIWESGKLDVSELQKKLLLSLFENSTKNFNPYQNLFEETTAQLLKSTIIKFQPEFIIFGKLLTTIYLDIVKNNSKAKLILDLDESAHRQIKNLKPLNENPIHRVVFTKWYEVLATFEDKLLKRFDQVWLSSLVEIDSILNLNSGLQNLKHVPNAISMEDYDCHKKLKDEKKIVFTGNFSYSPNQKAAKFILNELLPIMPEFNFYFAGSHMPFWMKSFHVQNVKMIENVENMGEFLSDSFVSLVPLTEGCGTRLKVLEAFASKIPIISTAVGVEGLRLSPDKHYFEAHTAKEFANFCRIILVDAQKSRAISNNAFEFVKKNHSIPSLSHELQLLI